MDAALAANLDALAITDHNSVAFVDPLRKAADDRLVIFPGIEVSSADGYHVLCIFDPDTTVKKLEGLLIRLGIEDGGERHADGAVRLAAERWTFAEILKEVDRCHGICIAPHVRRDNGLLKSPMANDIRVRNWLNPLLLAVEDDQLDLKAGRFADDCMLNTRDTYKRDRPVARVWGSDAKSFAAIGSSQTLIKMVAPSVEGLRQAFLDPGSRIRHPDRFDLANRDRIASVRWDGGFLSGGEIDLSEQLTCLIGGKGTGKSTVIESLRFALEAGEPTDSTTFDRLIENTLTPGTKVCVDVERRDGTKYTITRTPPYAAEVIDGDGELVDLRPGDVFDIDVYSQGQILETARKPMAHLSLLDSFIEHELLELQQAERTLLDDLAESRREVVALSNSQEQAVADQTMIARLKEARKSFVKKGVAKRTELRRRLDREQRHVRETKKRIDSLHDLLKPLKALEELPALLDERSLPHALAWKALLPKWEKLGTITREFRAVAADLLTEIGRDLESATDPESEWAVSVRKMREEVAAVYRDLEDEFPELDLSQFERIDRQLDELAATAGDSTAIKKQLDAARALRSRLLSQLRDNRRQQFRVRDELATRLNDGLRGAVKIDVQFQARADVFLAYLSDLKTKTRKEALELLVENSACTPDTLGEALLSGADAVVKEFGLTASQASGLTERLNLDAKLHIQEFQVPDGVIIEFNIANEGEGARYRELTRLSVGQKATSILLILLAEQDRPLVIDQPEDDLDNRFVYKDVVERIRDAKDHRQLILATHNANIPVLGDAEQIAVLDAEEAGGKPSGRVEDAGSIDSSSIKEWVTQILEGGKEAFRRRQEKYGLATDDSVSQSS